MDSHPAPKDTCVKCIRNLARYYRRSPDLLGESEIRRFFLHLIHERKPSEGGRVFCFT